jgi:hypothetical protein
MLPYRPWRAAQRTIGRIFSWKYLCRNEKFREKEHKKYGGQNVIRNIRVSLRRFTDGNTMKKTQTKEKENKLFSFSFLYKIYETANFLLRLINAPFSMSFIILLVLYTL